MDDAEDTPADELAGLEEDSTDIELDDDSADTDELDEDPAPDLLPSQPPKNADPIATHPAMLASFMKLRRDILDSP